jgi:glycosyltransferase involved in cell wall biosynthesis
LRRAVLSLLNQDFPADRFEILIVDNGSSDDTRSVLNAFQNDGRLRVLQEPRLGVAHARETGWRAARAETIVFIDDDCVAPRGWLRALVTSLDARGTDVVCVGGRVRADWAARRPSWLSDAIATYLGIQDLGPVARPIGPAEWLCSNNLALRRAALERAGGFRTDLGRRGTRLTDGAETELEQRLMSLGYACWYDPAVEIDHHIGPERLAVGWFLRRAFWSGASSRWTSRGSAPRELRRSGISAAQGALVRGDLAALACTAVRALGYFYAAGRPNPHEANRA